MANSRPSPGSCYVPAVTPVGHAAVSYVVAVGLRSIGA
jgi:hypothetical protein